MKGYIYIYIYISVKSISPRALCNTTITMLIFCLEDLSILQSGVLKSASVSVLQSISLLKSFKIFHVYLGAPILGTYMLTMLMSSSWILPLSIMKCLSVSLFMAFFQSLFFLVKVLLTQLSFPVHLLGIIFSNPSVCVGLLFYCGSLLGTICVGHDFLSI